MAPVYGEPMKTLALLPIAFLALFTSNPLHRPMPHELTDSGRARIEKQVSEFLGSYLEAIESHDAETIRKLFVDDGRLAWFTDGEKRYTSADQVIARLASMNGVTLSTEGTDIEIVPLTPDLCHARTAFHTKVNQAGAVVYEFDGVTTWLLEMRNDEWRVLTGHTSTPKSPR